VSNGHVALGSVALLAALLRKNGQTADGQRILGSHFLRLRSGREVPATAPGHSPGIGKGLHPSHLAQGHGNGGAGPGHSGLHLRAMPGRTAPISRGHRCIIQGLVQDRSGQGCTGIASGSRVRHGIVGVWIEHGCPFGSAGPGAAKLASIKPPRHPRVSRSPAAALPVLVTAPRLPGSADPGAIAHVPRSSKLPRVPCGAAPVRDDAALPTQVPPRPRHRGCAAGPAGQRGPRRRIL